MALNKSAVANRIRNIDQQVVDQYTSYLESNKPRTISGRRKRWIFAAMSIDTCWQQNVANYKTVMAMPWDSLSELREVMIFADVTLHTAKSASVWAITQLYNDPNDQLIFAHPAKAGWQQKERAWAWFRDCVAEVTTAADDSIKKIPWAGLKVVSFAHELCWPRDCRVLAVDTHVAEWYGVKGPLSAVLYHTIEEHWLAACERYEIPPAIARNILWDRGHGYADASYWTDIFEDKVLSALQTA